MQSKVYLFRASLQQHLNCFAEVGGQQRVEWRLRVDEVTETVHLSSAGRQAVTQLIQLAREHFGGQTGILVLYCKLNITRRLACDQTDKLC